MDVSEQNAYSAQLKKVTKTLTNLRKCPASTCLKHCKFL